MAVLDWPYARANLLLQIDALLERAPVEAARHALLMRQTHAIANNVKALP